MEKDNKVAIFIDKDLKYPLKAPYHPDETYPELKAFFNKLHIDPENHIYAAVRNVFRSLELDRRNYGTDRWNPLSYLIKPGDRVLMKPNLVMHEYGNQVGKNAMHTHGSLIRAMADYALLALRGDGELIIADSPIQEADFSKIERDLVLKQLKDFYFDNKIANFTYYDLRREWAVLSSKGGMIIKRVPLPGDPRGMRTIDLAGNSMLEPITKHNTKFSITNYKDIVTQQHHCPGKHQYLISQTLLDADVVLNVPKLKTHMKTGFTCCLKNLVGINVSKDYLPHHRVGSLAEGGDEFPEKTLANVLFKRVRERLNERAPVFVWNSLRTIGLPFRSIYSRIFDKKSDIAVSKVYGGSWYGNDTTWRMVHDINKIVFFTDKRGKMNKKRQRKHFAIVDAIIAGEREGPLTPLPKHCGMLICGFDPIRIDTVAALCMGFDPEKIPMLSKYNENRFFKISDYNGFTKDIEICFNEQKDFKDFRTPINLFNFMPPAGWKYHIELINYENE